MRVHGAWVSDEEVKAVCEFLRTQGTAVYEEVVLATEDEVADGEAADRDDLYWDAVHLVIGQRQASISFLQRRMRLGYPKAARFIDMMEQDRVIGPGEGAKPREVLVGPGVSGQARQVKEAVLVLGLSLTLVWPAWAASGCSGSALGVDAVERPRPVGRRGEGSLGGRSRLGPHPRWVSSPPRGRFLGGRSQRRHDRGREARSPGGALAHGDA